MQIVSSIAQIRHVCADLRRRLGPRLGLVPTMGALHEGHLSLVRAARESSDCLVVSIFINPLQFGPQEDFARYPRSFDHDVELLEREGVDAVFAPAADEMYPHQGGTMIAVSGVGDRLDGASRPGHFSGVATVVAKLFHLVEPDSAYFGQKDAAQVAVLRAMVRDLNFNVDLVVCPTLRDDLGLALSSRNRYLSNEERTRALALSRALFAVQHAVAQGQCKVDDLRSLLESGLACDGVRVDYAAIVHPDTLLPLQDLERGALVAVAAWVGETRLIDNILLPAQGAQS